MLPQKPYDHSAAIEESLLDERSRALVHWRRLMAARPEWRNNTKRCSTPSAGRVGPEMAAEVASLAMEKIVCLVVRFLNTDAGLTAPAKLSEV